MRRVLLLGMVAVAVAVAAARMGDGSDGGAAAVAPPAPERGAAQAPQGAPPAATNDTARSPAQQVLVDSAPRRVRGGGELAPRDVSGLIAKVRAGAVLPVRDRPGGRVVGRIRDRTDFGSRTALTVFARRDGGRWIGVATTTRPAGRLGWIRVRPATIDWYRTDRALHVDLSERRMELRVGGRVVRRATVGVGRPATPTPTGRFGVTDRLLGGDFGYWYGCCIIAFTGVQPHLPAGWQGGNRIAVHGTPSASTIGAAASAGCLRASDDVLERLMVEVPLGAPVHIRA